eukprot:4215106-Ditylum_brightwellii.AAC.1
MQERKVVLIIDEILMITPIMLAVLDTRLKKATGLDKNFRGIPVFAFGDFNQINPVKSTSLPKATIALTNRQITLRRVQQNKNLPKKRCLPICCKTTKKLRKNQVNIAIISPNSFHVRGVNLSKTAKWYALTHQQRSKDKDHTDLINCIGNGESLSMDGIKKYKILDQNELDDEEWALL